MNLDLSHCYLAVMNEIAGQYTDETGANYDPGAGGPDLKADGWTVTFCGGKFPWYLAIRNSDGLVIQIWRASQVGTQALFAGWGPQTVLDGFATSNAKCMPSIEAWYRATGTGTDPSTGQPYAIDPTVRSWLRYWPDWRVDGHEVDPDTGAIVAISNAKRILVPDGVQIPDPTVTALPWLLAADGTVVATQAAAVIQVTALHHPALSVTSRDVVNGWDLHHVLENEPVRG